jgi:hypothetical protein
MQKRNKSITISCTSQDLVIAEQIRDTVRPFPPSKATLGLLLVRHGLCELLRGNLTLVGLAETYSEIDMEAMAAQIEQEAK